jgi:TetR/AcrR family transcriptional repressor of nem operon
MNRGRVIFLSINLKSFNNQIVFQIFIRFFPMDLKETIIVESLKLFSLNGFLSTSIKDILGASGASKGGLYNHFSSKEDLFFSVLDKARQIWREKNLFGLDDTHSPVGKITKLLENFRDRYLKDSETFPGGCVFITFSVELNDSRPHLSNEINKGFTGLKSMIKRLIDQGKAAGELHPDTDAGRVTEVLFSGMLGATVIYGLDKSTSSLDNAINALIDYLENMKV